jgi:hypothetical protein
LRERDLLLLFSFWFLGLQVAWVLIGYKLRVLNQFRSWSRHEIGWTWLYKQPTGHAKIYPVELGFLPLLAIVDCIPCVLIILSIFALSISG